MEIFIKFLLTLSLLTHYSNQSIEETSSATLDTTTNSTLEQSATYQEDVMKAISKDSNITYFALLKEIFPDLQQDGSASINRDIHDLSFQDEIHSYHGSLLITGIDTLHARNQGKNLIIMLIEVQSLDDIFNGIDHTNFIASFEDVQQSQKGDMPKLLDIIEISPDPNAHSTYFWHGYDDLPQDTVLPVKKDTDAFWLKSGHSNTSESFINLALISFDQDHLKKIFGYSGIDYQTAYFPLKGHLGDYCSNYFSTPIHFSVNPEIEKDYHTLAVEVEFSKLNEDRNKDNGGSWCRPEDAKYAKKYTYTLHWDSSEKVYKDSPDALKELNDFQDYIFNL